MKKTYTYFVLSIVILIMGIVFTLSGVLLQTLPLSSKSALLIFSTAFIIIGCFASAIYYRKYQIMKALCTNNIPIVARWSYPANSSATLKSLIKDQKSNTLATALLILILALIFSLVFAHSGGSYILGLGYTFAMLSLLIFVIAQRFISAYYNHLLESENEVIFGEHYIFFLDEIYPLQKSFYSLEKIDIYIGTENLLTIDYHPFDVDYPDHTYSVTIPIPQNQLTLATYLKNYYTDFIKDN